MVVIYLSRLVNCVTTNSLRLIRSHKECELLIVQWVSYNVGLGGEVVGKKLPSYRVGNTFSPSRIARQAG